MESVDEQAKGGARLDGGEMAQVRAVTVQQEREEVTQHCNTQLASAVWWRNGKIVKSLDQSQKENGLCHQKKGTKKHRTEWYVGGKQKYRCMRCGRSSKHFKIQNNCEGPMWLREDPEHKLGRWRMSHVGGHDMV